MALVRLSENQDPIHYPLGLAEVLSHYPRPVIDKVCSVSGIPSESEWMPSIKAVKEACEKELRHYELLNKPAIQVRRYEPRKLDLSQIPNLFVPDNAPRYEEMMDKHQKTGRLHSYVEIRACHDGVKRTGVWIPYGWYYDRDNTIIPPLSKVTDALKPEPAIVGTDDDDFEF